MYNYWYLQNCISLSFFFFKLQSSPAHLHYDEDHGFWSQTELGYFIACVWPWASSLHSVKWGVELLLLEPEVVLVSIKLENVHVLGVVLLHQPPVQQNINLFVLKLNPALSTYWKDYWDYSMLCLEEPLFPRVTQNPRGDSPSTWKIQNWPSPYSLVVAIPPFWCSCLANVSCVCWAGML